MPDARSAVELLSQFMAAKGGSDPVLRLRSKARRPRARSTARGRVTVEEVVIDL